MYPESTSHMFAAFDAKARGYLREGINAINRKEKAKLVQAVRDKKVATKNFEVADINLLEFDWCSPDMDRNWWWQMQSLPFLNWFVQAYEILDDDERLIMTEYCINALKNWVDRESSAKLSPLRWHDHATAYRLTNIVNWLITVGAKFGQTRTVINSERSVDLANLVNTHVQWLCQEQNYSKNTNHGFDQALCVYQLGLYVNGAYWQRETRIARERLLGELHFAFTDEGVHKENSPGYHLFMMNRLEKLVRLEQIGDQCVGAEARRILGGAKKFLDAITLPSGYLPMVGDTKAEQKGAETNVPDDQTIYDFSESGYVVVKGRFGGRPYYLLVKCSHESNYHRHDDDLALLLYFDGEVVLGDGGLGSHVEKDRRRQLLRSVNCHNAPYLEGVHAIRNRFRLREEPTLSIENSRIVGVSYSYGTCLKRTLNITSLSSGFLEIKDDIIGEATETGVFAINYFSPLSTNEHGSGIFSIENKCAEAMAELRVPQVSRCVSEMRSSLVSCQYGVYEEAFSVRVSSPYKGRLTLISQINLL